MTAATAESAAGMGLVKYTIADKQIAEWRESMTGLTASTKEGYEQTRKSIAVLRDARSTIEKTRKELKADALEYGRKVDAEAKRLTAMIEEIEEPLKAEKARIDDEAARVKREAEEKLRLEAEAKARAEREAEQARLAEERAAMEAERRAIEAERQRLAAAQAEAEAKARAEREAHEEKLRAERAEQEARMQAERARLDAERDRLEAERQRLAKIEQDRQEAEAAALRAEREAIEADRRAIAEAEAARVRAEQEAEAERQRIEQERLAAEAEAARLEALRPDVDKIHDLANVLRSIERPDVASKEASNFLLHLFGQVKFLAQECERFTAQLRW